MHHDVVGVYIDIPAYIEQRNSKVLVVANWEKKNEIDLKRKYINSHRCNSLCIISVELVE